MSQFGKNKAATTSLHPKDCQAELKTALDWDTHRTCYINCHYTYVRHAPPTHCMLLLTRVLFSFKCGDR